MQEDVREERKEYRKALQLQNRLVSCVNALTADSILSDCEQEKGFTNALENSKLINVLKILGKICRKQGSGADTDNTIDIISNAKELLLFKQHNNMNANDFARMAGSLYDAQYKIGGELPFGANIMHEVIKAKVGSPMTLGEYIDVDKYDTDMHKQNRALMSKAYKEYFVSHLLCNNAATEEVMNLLRQQQSMAEEGTSVFPV